MTHQHGQLHPTYNRLGRWSLVFTLGLLLFSVSMGQAATDKKIFPATICQPWGGETHSVQSAASYSQFGAVFNTHESEQLSVICPVLRDNSTANLTYARIYFDDRHPTLNVRCRLRGNTAYGQNPVDSDVEESSGTGSSFFQLSGVQTTQDSTYPGIYTIICSIPPVFNHEESSIGSLVIQEP